MADILSGQISDTVTSGTAVTGPVTVHTSGVYDGATIQVETAATDTAGEYQCAGRKAQLRQPGPINVDGRGSYYLRLRQTGSGANTSITAKTTQ